MLLRYLDFLKIIRADFGEIIKEIQLYTDRIRLTLEIKSWIEIRYPVLSKFSFHWELGNSIYRFDTAPHHPDLASYPRHIHFQREENVLEDRILAKDGTPEDHLRQFLNWVKDFLRKKKSSP